MVNPVSHQTHEDRGYQQALDHFGITQLIAKLSSYSDRASMSAEQSQLESLAAKLIADLVQNINAQAIANYLNATPGCKGDAILNCINLKLPQPPVELPADFSHRTDNPYFLYGDKVRWVTGEHDSDWGTVIGRFYSFAPHLGCWTWCYLVWLAKESCSAAWTSADIAWEQDLEPLTEEINL
ncbi:hypothetical protein NIES2107_11730 [Nostoc carneum NIES-2107]|nr:hypothetical protein NIES2107_11730 [Nostoc carneum NIES-2107]